jgi:hypothetical protein
MSPQPIVLIETMNNRSQEKGTCDNRSCHEKRDTKSLKKNMFCPRKSACITGRTATSVSVVTTKEWTPVTTHCLKTGTAIVQVFTPFRILDVRDTSSLCRTKKPEVTHCPIVKRSSLITIQTNGFTPTTYRRSYTGLTIGLKAAMLFVTVGKQTARQTVKKQYPC